MTNNQTKGGGLTRKNLAAFLVDSSSKSRTRAAIKAARFLGDNASAGSFSYVEDLVSGEFRFYSYALPQCHYYTLGSFVESAIEKMLGKRYPAAEVSIHTWN